MPERPLPNAKTRRWAVEQAIIYTAGKRLAADTRELLKIADDLATFVLSDRIPRRDQK